VACDHHEVFDLSVMRDEASDGKRSQQFRIEASLSSPSSTPPPPLDTLTACTDDDSVSSVSTQESSSLQMRSVFAQYWKVSRQEPSYPRNAPKAAFAASPLLSLPRNHLNFLSTQPENEVVLDKQKPLRSSTNRPRRSILPQAPRSYSVPSQLSSLPSACSTSTTSTATRVVFTRKTQSSPQLGQKQPGASCLRQSRFSPVNAMALSSSTPTSPTSWSASANNDQPSVSSSSVRFDMDSVAVLHFEPPQERYAEEGWSQYFGYGTV
jgi:hypothetical protein